MQGSKIRLSPAEAALFSDANVILTKNSVINKTVDLLAEAQSQMMAEAPHLVHEISPSPKISKGENYLGLPYIILDYPRVSNGNGLFFIRSMFWWGNFYSSTLQVAGSFKTTNTDFLQQSYKELADKNYFIGVNTDPWVHHFGEENYRSIKNLSVPVFHTIIEEREHTKIAAFWPLSEWDMAATNLFSSWRLLVRLIS